jgi:ArsR family transcriptional regulator
MTLRSPFSPAFNRSDAKRLAAVMKVVAEPQRLRIIAMLAAHGPLTGAELGAALGDIQQPTMTHHLNALTTAGLIHGRKESTAIRRHLDANALANLAGLLSGER